MNILTFGVSMLEDKIDDKKYFMGISKLKLYCQSKGALRNKLKNELPYDLAATIASTGFTV